MEKNNYQKSTNPCKKYFVLVLQLYNNIYKSSMTVIRAIKNNLK